MLDYDKSISVFQAMRNTGLLILLFAAALRAGPGRTFTVCGVIRNEDTGDPVTFVNVFLANTTRGAAADEAGFYRIDNIAPGRYDVVFSRIGYEIKIVPLHLSPGRHASVTLDTELTPKIIDGEEIYVEASRNKQWRRDLKRFIRIFIGESDNARRCEIRNPEVLDFERNPETGAFIARTDSLLRIENHELGYHLDCALGLFNWPTMEEGIYIVYPFYREMEAKDANQQARWIKRRRDTYNGSRRHFLWSLYHGRMNEDFFTLYKGELDYRSSLSSGVFNVLEPKAIQWAWADSNYSVKRFYYKGFFRVVNTLYGHDSRIKFKLDFADIDSMGNDISPSTYSVITRGDWGRYRVADMLPFDYVPD